MRKLFCFVFSYEVEVEKRRKQAWRRRSSLGGTRESTSSRNSRLRARSARSKWKEEVNFFASLSLALEENKYFLVRSRRKGWCAHPDLPCSPYPPISAFYPGIFARTRPYPNTLLTRCGYDRILFAVPATNIVHANTFARIRPVYRIYPRYTQRACFFACIHAIRGEYIEYACRPGF